MQAQVFEALVIGAGPAGAALGLFLSEKGIRTVIVEKKARIDHPLRCAEFVPLPLLGLFSKKVPLDYQPISSMQTHVEGRCLKETAVSGAVIDRPLFLKKVLERFMDHGGILLNPCAFLSAAKTGPGRGEVLSRIHDIKRDRLFDIRAKTVFCCEGPVSKVKRMLGCKPAALLPAVCQNIEAEAADPCKTQVFFEPYIRAGYGWVFPKQGSINIGIGAQSGSLQELLERFRKDLQDAGILPGPARATRTACGLIPVSAMVPKPVIGPFVLAGDAAHLCHPITGAGIYHGVLSARICAEHAARAIQAEDLSILEGIGPAYHAHFGRTLQRAYEKREVFSHEFDSFKEGDLAGLVRRCWVAFSQVAR